MPATRIIPPSQLDTAIDILREGGLVVFPTDTVYGVAALARDAAAVAAIYRAKQRPSNMPIPVMVGDPMAVSEIAIPAPGFRELADAFWPGPLTIILPRRATLPDIVTAGGDTVALRVPDHPLVLALLRVLNEPLAVTSANRSGHPPALTADDARVQLDGRVEAIIDGGPAPGGLPSTIIDLTRTPPQILRRGPVTEAQIRAILANKQPNQSEIRISQ
jgi:L-threonylcarbamoyladenylate synthase